MDRPETRTKRKNWLENRGIRTNPKSRTSPETRTEFIYVQMKLCLNASILFYVLLSNHHHKSIDIGNTVGYTSCQSMVVHEMPDIMTDISILTQEGVVNISQLFTVNKSYLSQKIGRLSEDRMNRILQAISLLTDPREVD